MADPFASSTGRSEHQTAASVQEGKYGSRQSPVLLLDERGTLPVGR
jgi:glutaredoxin